MFPSTDCAVCGGKTNLTLVEPPPRSNRSGTYIVFSIFTCEKCGKRNATWPQMVTTSAPTRDAA
jgi:hypothetical protein